MVETPITVEEYLTNPAYRHCEYVDGGTIELNVGPKKHARAQSKCSRRLDEYLDDHPVGYVGTELHCKLTIAGQTRFRLPDIALVLEDPEEGETRYLERAPDLVVEVRSPEDSLRYIFGKLGEYFENGAQLAWIILPEESSVLVCNPGAHPKTRGPGDTLDGGDLLPGLVIAVDDLFI